jgi:hypothetical protein
MKRENINSVGSLLKSTGVLDNYYIMQVVTDYNDGKFIEMARLITEYGKHRFFQDLYNLFDSQGAWRSRTNQYLNFVGITIAYMKYSGVDYQRPQSE